MDCKVKGGSGPNAKNIMEVNGAVNSDGSIRNYSIFEAVNASLTKDSPVSGVFFEEVDGFAVLNRSLVERVDTVNGGKNLDMTGDIVAESAGLPKLQRPAGFKSNC